MAQYNINVGVNSYQAARGIAQIRTNLNQLNNAADRSRNLLSNLFITPLIGIYTMQAALTNVITTMAQFSRSMAEVRAITGGTERQIQGLENEFVRLGRTTRFTASQAAQAGVFLARAGFEAGTIREVSEATLDLALAVGVDTAKAADIATNVLTAFRLETEDLGEVFDQLAFVTARTNTDLLALAEALKFIAPAAESANIPLNQVIAALGILAQAGIRGSIAGTGLRRVISRLASETPIIEKRLDTLGLSFEDVNLRSGNLIGVFETLIRNGVDLGDAFALFGDRGGPAFEAVADRLPELIRLSNETARASGFVEDLAQIMSENLLDALIRVASAMEAIILGFRQVGAEDALIRFLDSLTARLRAIAADVSVLADILESLFVLIVGTLGAFLTRNLVPALAAITGLLPVFRALSGVVGSVAGILTSLLRGGVPVAIATLGASILGLGGSILGSLQRFFFIGTSLIIGFSDHIRVLNSVIVTLQDFLVSLGLAIFNALAPADAQITTVREGFQSILDAVLALVGSEAFLRGLVRAFDLLVRSILATAEGFRLLFTGGSLIEAIDNVVEAIQTRFRRLFLLMRLDFEDAFQAFNPFESAEDEANRRELIAGFESLLARTTIGEDIVNGISDAFETGRLEEILNQPLITFEEVSEAALQRAQDRIQTFTEEQRRNALAPLPVREALGPPPAVLSLDQRQERAFQRYLDRQRDEIALLGLSHNERRIRNMLLEAERELEFELNESQERRLRNLIVESQVTNQLNQFRRTIGEENMLLQTNIENRSTQSRILELQRDLYRDLTAAERVEVEHLIQNNEALQRQNQILEGLRRPAIERLQNIEALEALLARGAITLREFNQEVDALQLALAEETFTQAGATFADGFILGILRVRDELKNLQAQIALDLVGAIMRAGDSFANTAARALFHITDWNDALKEIARTLIIEVVASLIRVAVQLTINNALAAVFATLTGGQSIGGPLGFIPRLLGFQQGGIVDGPGTATSDSILARLSRGEFVVNAEATRRNRDTLEAINRGEDRTQRPVNINFNIQTPDADSFRRSEQQILNRARNALSRA